MLGRKDYTQEELDHAKTARRPTMRSAAHDLTISTARADALFASALQPSDEPSAAQVRRALELDPERIAHGDRAIDDAGVVRELAARSIPLDLCPTSNVQAGIVETVAAHPLARLHRAGVPVTLSTDDTTVSDLTLTEEYLRAVKQVEALPADQDGADKTWVETVVRQSLEHFAKARRIR